MVQTWKAGLCAKTFELLELLDPVVVSICPSLLGHTDLLLRLQERHPVPLPLPGLGRADPPGQPLLPPH